MGACANKSVISTVQHSHERSSPEVCLSNPRLQEGLKGYLVDRKKVNSVPCLSLESSPLYRRRTEGEKSLTLPCRKSEAI